MRWMTARLGLLLLLTAACTSAGGRTPVAQPSSAPSAAPLASAGQARAPAHVVAGYIPAVATAPIYLAIDKGFYAEQQIDTTLETLTNGNDIVTQTAAGHLNIGTGASVGAAALNAFSTGLDIKFFATGHGDYAARPNSPTMLRRVNGRTLTVPELRGRKVAINSIGVTSEYIAAAMLRSGGLMLDDVDLQQMPFPDIYTALENGVIDAGSLPEPLQTRALQAGIAEPAVNVTPDHMQVTEAWINTTWMQQNLDVARRFTVAYLRALRELQGDALARDDIAAIISKYTRIEPAIIKVAAPAYWDPDGRINFDSLIDQQRFYLERGELRYREPLDLHPYLDESLLGYALQQLGPAPSRP